MGEPDGSRTSSEHQMTRAVFLDRDGVINRAVIKQGRPYPPPSVKDLEFLPRVKEAVEKLKRADFRLIVVTNQPDVATGLQQREVVEAMHEGRCRRSWDPGEKEEGDCRRRGGGVRGRDRCRRGLQDD